MKEIHDGKKANAPDAVKQIALVGTGTIGAAWAAHFLAQGLDVIASDPGPDAEKQMRTAVDNAWPALVQLGLAKEASRERLLFTPSIEKAVENADFIQESTPEREAIKDQVITVISDAAKPQVVIASSTSGIVPSRLQAQCKKPQRLLVGHPFNPVYLIPLVEVVGGEKTSPETIRWAMAFYQHWGKTPLHCRVEKLGHLANRLQDAVFAEAMQLIADGVATTDELDTALTAGPGLRWALTGSFLTAHMASAGGLSDVLGGKFSASCFSHFQGPDPDDQMIESILNTVQAQVGGRSLKILQQMRDEFLVGVLKLRADIKDKYNFDCSSYCPTSTPNNQDSTKEKVCN